MYAKLILMCIALSSIGLIILTVLLQVEIIYDLEYLLRREESDYRPHAQYYRGNYLYVQNGRNDTDAFVSLQDTGRQNFKTDRIQIKNDKERDLPSSPEDNSKYLEYTFINEGYKTQIRVLHGLEKMRSSQFNFKSLPSSLSTKWRCPPPRSSHQLRYRNSPAPRTALASLPGSGSTWLRHVLHQATGLLTVSAACDLRLRQAGFPEVCVDSKREYALLENNHAPEYWKYVRVILLIRNPYDAILSSFTSEFAYNSKSDLKFIYPDWRNHVDRSIMQWKAAVFGWLEMNSDDSILVVTYADLWKNPIREIRTIAAFLNIHIKKVDILCTYVNRDIFRLDEYSSPSKKNIYTEEMTDVIDEAFAEVVMALRKRFPDRLWNI